MPDIRDFEDPYCNSGIRQDVPTKEQIEARFFGPTALPLTDEDLERMNRTCLEIPNKMEDRMDLNEALEGWVRETEQRWLDYPKISLARHVALRVLEAAADSDTGPDAQACWIDAQIASLKKNA